MKNLFKKSLLVLMVAFIAVFTLSVTSKVNAADAYFEKVTSAPSDWAGTYLIVASGENFAFNGSLTTLDAASNYKEVTISVDNKITATAEVNAITFTIAKSGSAYTIKSESGYYIGNTANSNKLESSTSTEYTNTITLNNDGTVQIVGSGKSVLRFNTTSGQDRFRYFKSSTYASQKAIYLYKYTEATSVNPEPEEHICTPCPICNACTVGGNLCTGEKCPTHLITISSNAYTQTDVDVTLDTSTSVGITETILWESTNEEVATIENGVIKPHSVGTTTIKATAHGLTTTQEFKVYPTENSELTIAQSIEIIDLLGPDETPYSYTAVGVIKSIDTAYDSYYGNITVTITDGTDSIKAFRMIGGETLQVGQKIKVTGALMRYNSTYEFAQGCTYEIVQDDETISTVKTALNKIAAHMSLAYTYTKKTTFASKYSVVAGDLSYENGTAVESLTNHEVIITFDKGSNSNAPKYYTTGSAIRCYGGNTMTFNGNNISKIEFSFASGEGTNTISSDCGTFDTDTWTGLSNSVVLTIGGSSGHRRITTISVTYSGNTGEEIVDYVGVDFRAKFAVDSTVADIENIDSYGIKVSANGNAFLSTSETQHLDDKEPKLYTIVSFGDLLKNTSGLTAQFTVQAYVVVDGVTYLSETVKTFSIAEMIQIYATHQDYVDVAAQVTPLYEILQSLGCYEVA